MIPTAKSNAFSQRLRQLIFFLSAAVLLAGAATAGAQGRPAQHRTIKVRLLLADNSGESSSEDLNDILPLLKKNLRFNSYRLVSQRTTQARASTLDLPFAYKLQYTDVDLPSVTVSISRKAKTLLRTRLYLRPGRPVLVGGFQHGRDSTVILVLELRGGNR